MRFEAGGNLYPHLTAVNIENCCEFSVKQPDAWESEQEVQSSNFSVSFEAKDKLELEL
jgi:hypothetical protein